MAEQDRFDEIVRNRAAVHRDERLGLALAAAVDGAREQFLADAGFALDQHGNRRGCGFLRRAQHPGHRLAAGDDVGEGQPALAAVADALQFAFQRRRVEGVAQGDLQPLEADRLDDEVWAPARIADTTLSMPPCAVCTMTGTFKPASRIFARTPRPSRPGITRSSTTASIACVSDAVRAAIAASPLSTTRAHSRTSAPCFQPNDAVLRRHRRSKWWQPWFSPHATIICLESGQCRRCRLTHS